MDEHDYPLKLDPGGMLRGRLERTGGEARISLAGEFDLAALEGFRTLYADTALDGPQRIVIDLRAITFLDSSGIRALLEARDRSSGSYDLVVLDGSGPVRRTLELVGLEYLLQDPEPPAR